MASNLWDFARLEHLRTNQIPESPHLDFKDKRALTRPSDKKQEDGFSAHISAFANYEGGTLLFGANEQRDASGKTRWIGSYDGYLPTEMSSDWLEDKLRALVTPFHPHLTAYGIQTPKNGLVFAVDVPKSPLAPHQARDGKYYVRSGASSRFANHLEIEGIRHSGAPIDLGIEFYRNQHTGAAPDNVQSMVIGIVVRNNGTRATRGLYVAAYFELNSEVEFAPAGAIADHKIHEIEGREWTRCFIAFGGHTPEILFSGQNTQPMPFFEIKSKSRTPLSTSLTPGPQIRFEIQTLDGYRNTIVEGSRLLVRKLIPPA